MTPEIRTLEPGQKITEPGFYDIPLSVHHSQCCDGVSVTSGVLRTLELETPADVWAFHDLNPKARKKETTSAMYMGAAMAALIAGGPHELAKQFYVLKPDVPRRPSEAQWHAFHEKRAAAPTIKACKAWEKINASPKPPLTDAEVQLLFEMAEILRNDPAALMAMDGLPEITMAVQDEATGLWLLARPDTVNPEGLSTSDYKKIATKGGGFTKRTLNNRITYDGYGMQLAFADEVFFRLTGQHFTDHVIVGQWGEYPHHVIAQPIGAEEIEEDRFRILRSIQRFHTCMTSGHWPGPGEEVTGYWRDPDMKQRIREQMEEEGYTP